MVNFPSGRRELSQLGDGGHLAQQPQGIETLPLIPQEPPFPWIVPDRCIVCRRCDQKVIRDRNWAHFAFRGTIAMGDF